MDMDMFKKYNDLVVKYKLAEIFFDNDKVKVEEKEKRIGKVQDLYRDMSLMLKAFKAKKIEVTDIEALEGFNIEFRMERYRKHGY